MAVSVADHAKSPPGWALPIVLIGLLPFTYWSIRDSEPSKFGQVIFALSVSIMLWSGASLFQVSRLCRKFGLNREAYTRFLSCGRPDDKDELLLWQWTLQSCYAIAAFVVCMIALAVKP